VPGEDAGVFLQRVVTQNVLDRYLHRGQITLRQFDAGMRLYRLWRAAGSAASLTMTYAPRTDGSRELSEEQALRRSKLTSLLRRMGRFAEVLVHVCLCDQAARDWAVTRGDAPQAGVVVLRLALDQLADHWRL
jgi:hypothetical protein